MGSWITKRAQADPGFPATAEALRAESAILWERLRTILRQNVEEFNSLYRDRPDRVAELSEEASRATVRLKANPQISMEVSWEDSEGRLLCRFNTNQRSQLAAEMRIFGDWDSIYTLTFSPNGQGSSVLISGNRRMDPAEAAEFILAPVLFPA